MGLWVGGEGSVEDDKNAAKDVAGLRKSKAAAREKKRQGKKQKQKQKQKIKRKRR